MSKRTKFTVWTMVSNNWYVVLQTDDESKAKECAHFHKTYRGKETKITEYVRKNDPH